MTVPNRLPGADRRRLLLLGLMFSLVMYLAFRPFAPNYGLQWGVLVIPVLAGVVVAWRRGKSRAVAFWFALGTLPFWAIQHWFLTGIAPAGYPPLAVVLAVLTGLVLALTRRMHQRLPAIPAALILACVWTAMDVLRARVIADGYPWYFVSHPLIDTPLRHIASVVGVHGVTFVVVLCGASVAGLLASRPRRSAMVLATSLALGAGLLLYANLDRRSNRSNSPPVPLTVGIVQTNQPQSVKMRSTGLDRLESLGVGILLSRLVARHEPDVVVWPETMFPGDALDPDSVAELDRAKIIGIVELPFEQAQKRVSTISGIRDMQLFRYNDSRGEMGAYFASEPARRMVLLQKEYNIPMLVGTPAYDGLHFDEHIKPSWRAAYNSVVMLADGEVTRTRYDKVHLTPFGEVMPHISAWPWLERQLMYIGVGATGMSFELSPGHDTTRFSIASTKAPAGPVPVSVVTPICFEATMSNVCRRLVVGSSNQDGQAAQAMIQVTNDGWFFDWDAGREEHLRLARWRCVELGVPMVRCANTGISCAIDDTGKVTARGITSDSAGLRCEGYGIYRIQASGPKHTTIFRSVGDLIGWVCLGCTTVMVLVSLRRPVKV